jgi:dynein light chain 4
MLTELTDSIINGIEAFATFPNMAELATKSIKESLDKRYGPAWHVVIGEGYAYDISVQSGAYLLMFYNGNLGCLVFKT